MLSTAYQCQNKQKGVRLCLMHLHLRSLWVTATWVTYSSTENNIINDKCKIFKSTLTHLKNGLPVASKLANTSRYVRDRRNSISEIHGAEPGPLSEIDGWKCRLRRGQLPWYSVSSLSCCHSCMWLRVEGREGSGPGAQSASASKSQRLNIPRACHNNNILSQSWAKVSPTWRGLIDGCCKSMSRVQHGVYRRGENGGDCRQLAQFSLTPLCFTFRPHRRYTKWVVTLVCLYMCNVHRISAEVSKKSAFEELRLCRPLLSTTIESAVLQFSF